MKNIEVLPKDFFEGLTDTEFVLHCCARPACDCGPVWFDDKIVPDMS